MIQLRDTVFIETPPEKVWAWLSDLPDHYREWHPAHVRCRYVQGNTLATGAVFEVEEDVHGRRHRLRLRATEIVPNRLVGYSRPGMQGAFWLERANGGTRFTATLSFGIRVPLIGRIADYVLGRVLANRLAAVQQHMHEEGRNLKRLLERREG